MGLGMRGLSRIGLAFGALTLASFSALTSAQAAPSICDGVSGNLVQNCGFEAGTVPSAPTVPLDWTPNAGYTSQTGFNQVQSSAVNSGNEALRIGNFDYEPVPSLTQAISDVSGSSYSGSIYVNYGGAEDNDTGAFFDVDIDGTPVVTLNDSATNTWTQFFFSFTGTGSDTITLTGNTNPSEWYVDDVVVTGPAATTGVPEPLTLSLFGAGLVGAVTLRRRKQIRA